MKWTYFSGLRPASKSKTMKIRTILLMSLFVVCAARAQAQRPRVPVEWGVVGGINIVNFSAPRTDAEIGDKLGWQLGMHTALNFGAFAVEPEILYVRQGLRIRGKDAGEINLRSGSIDVPVLASLRLLRPMRIFAGPVFTVMNDCKQKSGGDLLDFSRVRPTVSYTVGIGATVMRHMLIDLRYNGQFSGKKEVALPDGGMLDKLRSHSVAISFGYLF